MNTNQQNEERSSKGNPRDELSRLKSKQRPQSEKAGKAWRAFRPRIPRELVALFEVGRRIVPQGYHHVIVIRGASWRRRKSIIKGLCAGDRNFRRRARRAGRPTYVASDMNPLVLWVKLEDITAASTDLFELRRAGLDAALFDIRGCLVRVNEFAITARRARSGSGRRVLLVRPNPEITRFLVEQIRDLARQTVKLQQIGPHLHGIHKLIKLYVSLYYHANRDVEFARLAAETRQIGLGIYTRLLNLSAREARKKYVQPVVVGRRRAPVLMYRLRRNVPMRGLFCPTLCSRVRLHVALERRAAAAAASSSGKGRDAGTDIASGVTALNSAVAVVASAAELEVIATPAASGLLEASA